MYRWLLIVFAASMVALSVAVALRSLGGGDHRGSGGLRKRPVEPCMAACERLAACGYCTTGESDQCISAARCPDSCTTPHSQRIAACLAALDDCDKDALSRCFDAADTPTANPLPAN